MKKEHIKKWLLMILSAILIAGSLGIEECRHYVYEGFEYIAQEYIADSLEGIFGYLDSSKSDASSLPPYQDAAYVVVDDNNPDFGKEDFCLTTQYFYEDLDDLGRTMQAFAVLGLDGFPTMKRESIQDIKPSGWMNAFYDFVDGGYVYNRCHLIGFQLGGSNEKENLMTGTRYMNVNGMLPFENMVADYIKETENHVLYRVIPVYENDNLVASGVFMEAMSIEDEGEGILFHIYCYNVQPGVLIHYEDGSNEMDTDSQQSFKT